MNEVFVGLGRPGGGIVGRTGRGGGRRVDGAAVEGELGFGTEVGGSGGEEGEAGGGVGGWWSARRGGREEGEVGGEAFAF